MREIFASKELMFKDLKELKKNAQTASVDETSIFGGDGWLKLTGEGWLGWWRRVAKLVEMGG